MSLTEALIDIAVSAAHRASHCSFCSRPDRIIGRSITLNGVEHRMCSDCADESFHLLHATVKHEGQQ